MQRYTYATVTFNLINQGRPIRNNRTLTHKRSFSKNMEEKCSLFAAFSPPAGKTATIFDINKFPLLSQLQLPSFPITSSSPYSPHPQNITPPTSYETLPFLHMQIPFINYKCSGIVIVEPPSLFLLKYMGLK